MKKELNIYIALFVFLATGILNFSCSDDRADELKSIEYDRLFSPTKLEALVINRTDARLSWATNKDVESYTLEVFIDDSLTFNGTPAMELEGIKTDQLPYYLQGLEGQTRYSVRIKSVSSGETDSKWTGVSFLTGTEDIFLPFEDGDLKATSVTLRWDPNKTLTEITLEPGGIVHKVTPQEIAAGMVTIDGLVGETAYTATLKNGAKIRGVKKFSTLVDIGDATAVYPEDDFIALISSANDGDKFALFPGNYGEGDKFTINKNIEIKGVYPYDKPVLNGYISIEDGAGLLLKDITLDGTGLVDGNQAIIFNTTDVTYNDLKIDGCEMKNYSKGLLYLNVTSLVKTITFNNNIIYNIECNGGDFIDSRKGTFNELNFTNNTVYNSCVARDFIRFDDASSSFPAMTPQIKVDHNTLYGICDSSSKRLLYVRFKGNVITFTNTIVAETVGMFSNQANTDPTPTFGGNNFFNAPGLFSATGSGSKFYDDSASNEDLGFVNANEGNFTITNEVLKAKGTGDPRWIK